MLANALLIAVFRFVASRFPSPCNFVSFLDPAYTAVQLESLIAASAGGAGAADIAEEGGADVAGRKWGQI